ncbi:hypothetical protein RJ639_022022 [Escallonia herrerae]|uniref:O-methyltransferase dimerisation domain-containing protein n=1 Tax=Escallonia herrerae TaxID=1293975 RepID=A0AA88V4W9_9ASTE|nr:hypothetical protein RJ639_022022 [Escallonia herrerae]
MVKNISHSKTKKIRLLFRRRIEDPGDFIRHGLERETEGETERTAASKNEEKQPQVDIWKCVLGLTESAVVKCAIELGIADALENSEGPMSLFELSSSLGCSPPALYRIMRFLVHRGIFSEKSTSKGSTGYIQTPISRLLIKRGENSMAALVLFLSSPVLLAPWQCLSARVLACETPAFEAAHGKEIFQHAATDPAQSKLMDDTMACGARVTVPAMMVVLRSLRDSMLLIILRDKGKVIILEAVIEEKEKERDQLKDLGLMMDMAMMAYTGKGKERTLKE